MVNQFVPQNVKAQKNRCQDKSDVVHVFAYGRNGDIVNLSVSISCYSVCETVEENMKLTFSLELIDRSID